MKRILFSIVTGIKMSVIEMTSHKVRSFLSILGVMLGVASLGMMLTLLAGVDTFLNQKMGRWAGSIWFWSRRDVPVEEKIAWSRSPSLRFSDGIYLEEQSQQVEHYFRTIERRGRIYIKGQPGYASVKGVDQISLEDDLENAYIARGRQLTEDDYVHGNRVCVISWEIEERVQRQLQFSNIQTTDLVGQECIFQNVRLTIVGIFEPDDPEFTPGNLRRSVYIPLSAMKKYVTGIDPHPGALRVSVTDPKKITDQAVRISRTLQERHRGVEDFEYGTAEWLDEIRSLLNNISILMMIISVIALVVGGLSIMNVMLSSISERIREIGIRKALGAGRLQLFIQFITETVTLSFTGGVMGVCIGLAIPFSVKDAIKKASEGSIEPVIYFTHIIAVFLIIVGVGILFGLYPALKASRMNPIDALRYE